MSRHFRRHENWIIFFFALKRFNSSKERGEKIFNKDVKYLMDVSSLELHHLFMNVPSMLVIHHIFSLVLKPLPRKSPFQQLIFNMQTLCIQSPIEWSNNEMIFITMTSQDEPMHRKRRCSSTSPFKIAFTKGKKIRFNKVLDKKRSTRLACLLEWQRWK